MAALVLKETGLLPHANAGALYKDELGNAAQGVAFARNDDRVIARRSRTVTVAHPTKSHSVASTHCSGLAN